MKHVILVIVVGIIAATGVTAMFQRLSEESQRGLTRDALITDWRNQLRDYDNDVDRYELCAIAVEARQATREDNERENASDMAFIDIMDEWLDDDADAAIAEARANEIHDAQLDDAARPPLYLSDCLAPPESPPPYPDLGD